jgi:hypothetical protein
MAPITQQTVACHFQGLGAKIDSAQNVRYLVKVQGEDDEWLQGYCKIPIAEHQAVMAAVTAAKKSPSRGFTHPKCQAILVKITEDHNEELYTVSIEVNHQLGTYLGWCWVPKTKVDIELLNPYLIKTGQQPVMQSIEDMQEEELEIEEQNQYNRTIAILGDLTVGDRTSSRVSAQESIPQYSAPLLTRDTVSKHLQPVP